MNRSQNRSRAELGVDHSPSTPCLRRCAGHTSGEHRAVYRPNGSTLYWMVSQGFLRKAVFCAIWYIVTAGIPILAIFLIPAALDGFVGLLREDLPTFTFIITVCASIYHAAYVYVFVKVWRMQPRSSGYGSRWSRGGSAGPAERRRSR